MSEQSVIALVAVVVSGILGLGSLALSYWNSAKERDHRISELRAEHEERYRIGLYEKRLEIYQGAFSWSQKLGRSAFLMNARDGDPDALGMALDGLRDWIDSINLYLDPVSQHQLARLLQNGRGVVLDRNTYSDFTQQIEATQEAVLKGIALKHIDFTVIRDDLRRMREEGSGA